MVQRLPDVVVMVDGRGEVLFVSGTASPLAASIAPGKRLEACVRGEPGDRMLSVLRRALDARQVVTDELCEPSAGESRWYDVIAHPIAPSSGSGVMQALLCVRDVTDRRAAAAALEASERRFRALVEHGNDCIVLIAEDDTIQYASPALLRSLGYESHEMLGTHASRFVHPDDGPRVDDARGAIPGESVLGVVRLRHKDGSWRWHEGHARNLIHDPAVRAYVCNRRDITERRIEEERRAFQVALLAQVSQPVIAIDAAGALTYWNAAAERTFGWSDAEVRGQSCEALLGVAWPDGQGYEQFRASVHASGTFRGELEISTKFGTRIVVEASMRAQNDASGAPTNVIAVMQDVTERKRLEEELRQAQKMEAIGALAGGVAHDFNNLLAVILGFSEMAKRRLKSDDDVYPHVTEILDAAKRGADLTRKLLAFSRKQIIQLHPLDLSIAIEDFSRMLERVVGEDVHLVVAQNGEEIVVRADPIQLEQVLLNLCTNARQAMPSGGELRLSTRTCVLQSAPALGHPLAQPGRFAVIEVSDTGVGMDEATRARAFEPFFTTKPDGTGLGLATVYGIVQKHGGFVELDSKLGGGSTFRVFLPLAEQATRDERPKRASEAPARGSELVLVAEDEPSVLTLVATSLRELGYRVIETHDGEHAVREYEQNAKDIALVVLDVVMPRLDARAAYERMRAIRSDLRVLFITGYAPESTRIGELLNVPHTRLLEKPFTTKQLARMVRESIET